MIELVDKPSESVVNLVDGYVRGNLNDGQMLTVMGWEIRTHQMDII
ncbi:hypothetical protein OH492_08910 [Vibrio chagasii]|nr:hypothetical protein [Vibrio chagasii]